MFTTAAGDNETQDPIQRRAPGDLPAITCNQKCIKLTRVILVDKLFAIIGFASHSATSHINSRHPLLVRAGVVLQQTSKMAAGGKTEKPEKGPRFLSSRHHYHLRRLRRASPDQRRVLRRSLFVYTTTSLRHVRVSVSGDVHTYTSTIDRYLYR